MAHVVVIGAGLGGLPAAYELRHTLPHEHRITVISNQPKFTFVPSLPWVGLGLKSLDQIQLDLAQILPRHDVEFIHAAVTGIDPASRRLSLGDRTLDYDYAVIATGPELALDALPGLGPEGGYTQSVCNPHHAVLASAAWEKFLADPGPIVVGAAPGASCFGPAYEFAFLIHHVLKQRGLRAQVPITFITAEPYAGHLGIGGMANSRWLMRKFMAMREIELMENTAISHFEPDAVHLADGRTIPAKFVMVLPPFRGPRFLREAPGLTDAQGFIPVLPTYRHPDFESIYAVGVITQLNAVESTPIPTGAPKVGLMSEEMALAVAHNLALELGVASGPQHRPTLQAICFANFGDTGALFLADPLLPDASGQRHRSLTYHGIWVSWMKTGFERYFLMKMRLGWTIPWFERWAFRAIGLPLVEPIGMTHIIERGIGMSCRMRKMFSRLLLLGAIVLGLFLGWGMLHPPSAVAAIRQLEEAPGQMVYQSRQTLQDQHGSGWQTVAFKRIRPDGQASFELRLVGFPGGVEIDRTQPLTLTNSLGKTLTATDVSRHIFGADRQPEPNVGQYDLQPLLAQLQTEIPLKLTLPTLEGEAIRLSVPAAFVQEWQTVSSYE